MALLTSTSTIAQVRAAYVDNADYDGAGSVAMARLFIQACRVLLLRMPAMSSQDRASVQLNPTLIAAELERALRFTSLTAANDGANGGGGVRGFDFSNFRC